MAFVNVLVNNDEKVASQYLPEFKTSTKTIPYLRPK